MPKEPKSKTDIEAHLDDIEKEAEELAGWDCFKITKIEKYETEAVVYSTLGVFKISLRELFEQYQLRQAIFINFGKAVETVRKEIYQKWLSKWAESMVDIGASTGTVKDRLQDSLITYLSSAEQTDNEYLANGSPIILPDNSVAFKSMEFTLWMKKRFGSLITENQVRSFLPELGCKPRQVGPSRIRAWAYMIPKYEEGQTKIDFEFEATGQAPERMNDESTEVEADGFEF